MIGFVLKRIAGYVATLLGGAVLIYLFFDLAGPERPELPLQRGLLSWLMGLAHGDLGHAMTRDASVAGLVLQALAVTLPLLALSLLLAAAIGLPLGRLAAYRSHAPAGATLSSALASAAAAPVAAIGVIFAAFAGDATGLGPHSFTTWTAGVPAAIVALLLPALAAALPAAGLLALAMRDATNAVRQADYIRTAEARGLTPGEALRRHGGRNIRVVLLARLGTQLALLIGGLYTAETVFELPGVSSLIAGGIDAHDLPVVRGGVLALMALIATVLLAVDLARAATDPRIGRRVA